MHPNVFKIDSVDQAEIAKDATETISTASSASRMKFEVVFPPQFYEPQS